MCGEPEKIHRNIPKPQAQPEPRIPAEKVIEPFRVPEKVAARR